MLARFLDFLHKRKRILIVEDDFQVAQVLSLSLSGKGFRTKIAGDGMEGVAMLSSFRPHLVILDVTLPKLNGEAVLVKAKSDPKLKHIPVLMCTALNMVDDVERYCLNGAAGYITKPFELARVQAKVQSILEKQS